MHVGTAETQQVDVLVVGGGLAGALAAIEAARTGARTAIMLKKAQGRASTTAVSGGGFAAALPDAASQDSPEEHFRDTIFGGEFLNDQRLVRIMVEEAPGRILDLERLGVAFERDRRDYVRRQAPGHSHARSVMAADMGQVVRALGTGVAENGVQVLRGLTLADVLVTEGRAVGAVCFGEEGRRVDVQAPATILATGGFGRLYPVTSNPPFATGDGHACGFRAGARLRDMEFVQFTPAGLIHPEALRGWSINHDLLAHPAVRITDYQGMPLSDFRRAFSGELADRLKAIRLLHQEGQRIPGGAARLDLRGVPTAQLDRLEPGLIRALAATGIDPARDLLEIAPEAHFSIGGLDVDEWGETSLPGLFAIGEAAAGCHGANRLTHNAFPEVIVFAPRAGKAAAERGPSNTRGTAVDIEPQWEAIPAPGVRQGLQEAMLAAAGPVRSADGLRAGLAALEGLRSRTIRASGVGPEEFLAGLATRNLLQVAELGLRAALRREESRGAHYREDHAQRNDRRWLVTLITACSAQGARLLERSVSLPYLRPEMVNAHPPSGEKPDAAGQPDR